MLTETRKFYVILLINFILYGFHFKCMIKDFFLYSIFSIRIYILSFLTLKFSSPLEFIILYDIM